jgi:hypothetical protein
MAIDYLQLTQTSVQQLSDLVRERRELEAKILKLKRQLRSTAAHLLWKAGRAASSVPSTRMGSVGVTDAVRRVLGTYPISLTPVSVRDLLPSVGFDPDRYKHPLTSIHSILRRLVATGEVARIDQPPNTTRYVWAEYLRELSGEPLHHNSEPVQSQMSARLCENESQKTLPSVGHSDGAAQASAKV